MYITSVSLQRSDTWRIINCLMDFHPYLLSDAYVCVAYMFIHTALCANALELRLSGHAYMHTHAELDCCYTCMHHAMGPGEPDCLVRGYAYVYTCWARLLLHMHACSNGPLWAILWIGRAESRNHPTTCMQNKAQDRSIEFYVTWLDSIGSENGIPRASNQLNIEAYAFPLDRSRAKRDIPRVSQNL